MRRYNENLVVEDDAVADVLDAVVEGGNQTLVWRGRKCWKNPLDLIVYQEIVHDVRPTLIVETGTHAGGSALFWHDMMFVNEGVVDAEGHALWRRGVAPRVITIDVRSYDLPPDADGITYLSGSSTDQAIVDQVLLSAGGYDVVLVNLDSDHAYGHVARELELYGPLVTPGSYLIVEDGVDDFRWDREGPYHATVEFLSRHHEFERDVHRERLGLTNCPSGFLRRATW